MTYRFDKNTMLHWDVTECTECAEKPGSPVLCGTCIGNRTKISELKKWVEELRNQISTLKKTTRKLPSASELAYGDAVLHQLWSIAAGQENYDKSKWKELEKLVHAGIEK